MSASFDEIDPVLINRFSNSNGTIFVGAGISMAAHLPSWNELIDPLRQRISKDLDSIPNHLDVAELYATKFGKEELVRHIKRSIGSSKYKPTKAHELIVKLPVQRIYTTNFDNLLERAAHDNDIDHHVIVNAADVGLSDASKLVIVKLHGDLSDPKSLVFSAYDYYSYFTKHPAVTDLLKVELQTRTVLFLGYSFSDVNLGMILGKIGEESGDIRPLLYSIQFKPRALVKKAFQRRGVEVIEIAENPGTPQAKKAIEDWLTMFRIELIQRDRRKQAAALSTGTERYSLRGSVEFIPTYKQTIFHSRHRQQIQDFIYSDSAVIVVKGEAGIGKTRLAAAVGVMLGSCV